MTLPLFHSHEPCNHLFMKLILQVDFNISQLMAVMTEHQKKYAKYAEKMSLVPELRHQLNQCHMVLNQTLESIETLNNALPGMPGTFRVEHGLVSCPSRQPPFNVTPPAVYVDWSCREVEYQCSTFNFIPGQNNSGHGQLKAVAEHVPLYVHIILHITTTLVERVSLVHRGVYVNSADKSCGTADCMVIWTCKE